MDRGIVLNKNTPVFYRGACKEPDGTFGHIYFVPNKNQDDGIDGTPSHHYVTAPNQVPTQEKGVEESDKSKKQRTKDKQRELEPSNSSKSEVPTDSRPTNAELQAALRRASERYDAATWSDMSNEQKIILRDFELQILYGKQVNANPSPLAHSQGAKGKTPAQPKDKQASTSSKAGPSRAAAEKEEQDRANALVRAKMLKIEEEKRRKEAGTTSLQTPSAASQQALTPNLPVPQLRHEEPESGDGSPIMTSMHASSVFGQGPQLDEEAYAEPILMPPPVIKPSHTTPEAPSSSKPKVKSGASSKSKTASSAVTPAVSAVPKPLVKSDLDPKSNPFVPKDSKPKQDKDIPQRPSVLISPVFHTITVDPNDMSVLRLLVEDWTRQIRNPTKCVVKPWDRWQKALTLVLQQMGNEQASELKKIQSEIDEAFKATKILGKEQKAHLKSLLDHCLGRTLISCRELQDCGPQTKGLPELEAEVLEKAAQIVENVAGWTTDVVSSVLDGKSDFAELANAALTKYTAGKDSPLCAKLHEELNAWIENIHARVQSASAYIRWDIVHAEAAFREQLAQEKQHGRLKQFLPSWLVVFENSVGLMLDTAVSVRFGEVVQSFKDLYMQVIEICPLDVYGDSRGFTDVWYDVHAALLEMLMLRNRFHITAPTRGTVSAAAQDLVVDQEHERMTASRAVDEERTMVGNDDSQSTLPGVGQSSRAKRGFAASSSLLGGAPSEATSTNTVGDEESQPASSSLGEPSGSKSKWMKQRLARLREAMKGRKPSS